LFEFLKDKMMLKEISKLFFALLKVMFSTGLVKVVKDTGSIEIFEYQGSLLIGLNTNNSGVVRDSINKLGDELKQLKLPTCTIDFDGRVITIEFNEKHKEAMDKVMI